MKAFRSCIAKLSKGKKIKSMICRLVSRSKRSKEESPDAENDEESDSNEDVPVSIGVISTEEDEVSTGSNGGVSLGTISTGDVSKEEDDASLGGSLISDATFGVQEVQQQSVRPSTLLRGLFGVGHALRAGVSSLANRAASFAKPLSTVGTTLCKKPRSALTTARGRFGAMKARIEQWTTSRKIKRERERREREREKRHRERERRERQRQRRERRRKKRKKREQEKRKFFRRGWKWRLLGGAIGGIIVDCVRGMHPKKWKCRLGERIKIGIEEKIARMRSR